LEVNLEKFLKAYTYNNDINKDNEEKYIFSLWLQGYENAPVIVKKTIESQKKYAKKYGYNYILLDEKNLYDFVNMPIELVEKYNTGKIDAIKYSDIIRTILLSEYGGVWLDSTIYLDCSEKLEYLESKFYTIRASGTEYYPRYVSNGRWALFCLAGEKNNIVFDFLKKIQLEYYRLYDSPIDYYLIDYLMEIGYKNIDEIKLQVDSVLDNNKKLYYLVDNFSNTFNRENWNEILEDNTKIDSIECSIEADSKQLDDLATKLKTADENITARPIKRVTQSQDIVLGKLQALVLLVNIVVLILTMISVSTTMMAVVAERRKEIGLKKALGAYDSEIKKEFLGEGSALGFIGGLLGVGLGFVFAQEVSLSVFGRAIEFQWLFAPITIIVSMIITTLACLYPVKKAMEIEPALVLKGE